MKRLLIVFILTNLWISNAYGYTMDQIDSTTLPNVIFILADDMGIGDLSCYNVNSKISTENLDLLASENFLFTDAHSGSAVCTPTRYGILTGQYAWRTKLKHGVLWAYDKPLIENQTTTMAEFFRENGYSTACIGKWHLGWDWPIKQGWQKHADSLLQGGMNIQERLYYETLIDFTKEIKGGPLDHGFDYYHGDDVPNFPPYTFIENRSIQGELTEILPDSIYGNKGIMETGWDLTKVLPKIQERSISYITGNIKDSGRDLNKPFFMYIPLTGPHTPIAPSPEFQGKSQAGAYGDFVLQIDHLVGHIVDVLKAQQLYENTIIIFTSDNGSPARNGKDMGGDLRSVLEYDHNPSYIYKGIKADIYEGGHRVPLIVKWTNPVRRNGTIKALTCLNDFYATFVELLGKRLEIGVAEDSQSMLNVFRSEQVSQYRSYVVHHSAAGYFSLRSAEGWKYIEGGGSGGWTFPRNKNEALENGEELEQLYQLHDDPFESQNLISTELEIKKLMIKELNTIKND